MTDPITRAMNRALDSAEAEVERHYNKPARLMRPTESLRFLERAVDQGDGTTRRVRVLQQGWADVHGGQIEWRDVPLVTE